MGGKSIGGFRRLLLLRFTWIFYAIRFQVCKRAISIAPVYAANAPARLPLPEFMLGLANKLMAWMLLLLSLLFAVCVWEFLMPLTILWFWRLALSRTLAQVRRLLSLHSS